MVNVTLMSFKIGLHIESSQPKNCSFPIDILIENCTFVNNIYDTILTFFYNIPNFGMAVGAVYISNSFTTFRRCIFRDNFGIQQAGHVYCAYGTGGVDLLNCSFFSKKKDVTISNMATSKTGTFIYSESAGSLKLVNTSMMSMVTNRNTYPVFDIVSGGFVDIDQNSEIKCCERQQFLLENNTHLQYTEKIRVLAY